MSFPDRPDSHTVVDESGLPIPPGDDSHSMNRHVNGGERRRSSKRVVLGWLAIVAVALVVPTCMYLWDKKSADHADHASELAVATKIGFFESEVEWSDTIVDKSPRDSLQEHNVVVSGLRHQDVLREYGAKEFCRLKSFGEAFPSEISRPESTNFYLYVANDGGQQKNVTVIVVGVRRKDSVVFISERPNYTKARNVCA